MTYIGSINEQVLLFCKTAGFGFLLGALYELFRILRCILTGGKYIFLWDVIYSLTASVCAFLFLLSYGNGKLRLFILTALSIGFAVYYLTVGKTVSAVTDTAIRIVKRLFSSLLKPIHCLFCNINVLFVRFCKRIKKFLKKVKKKFKFHLKFTGGMLYNSKR